MNSGTTVKNIIDIEPFQVRMLKVRLCLVIVFFHLCLAEKFTEYNDKDKVGGTH